MRFYFCFCGLGGFGVVNFGDNCMGYAAGKDWNFSVIFAEGVLREI